MSKKISLFEAIAVLVGTIIGAGILGVPFVIAQAGFITGLVVLLVVAFAMVMINLFLGEIVLSTNITHQLTGYAQKYLGKSAKYLTLLVTALGFYGALLVYIIGEGEVLAALTGGPPVFYSIIFFTFGAILVFLGLTVIKRFEFIMTLCVLTIVLVIVLSSYGLINFENLTQFSLAKIFIPYGVIFFAMAGSSAIPQLRQALRGKERSIKKAIIIGVTIPFAVYLIFTLVVIGVTGLNTTEIATIGLGAVLGKSMIIFGNLFAFFTMATSFLTLGLALKETYRCDLGLGPKISWLLTCLPPVIVFLAGLNNFALILSLVGAIVGGLDGLIILAIYSKLKTLTQTERHPEYRIPAPFPIIIFLSLLFIGGIIYSLWQV